MSMLDKVSSGLHSAGNSVQDGINKVGGAIEKMGPKELSEEQEYKKLPLAHQVQTGDVLLVKVFGIDTKAGPNVIRAGQFMFSRANGSANSEHAIIMVDSIRTAEAKGSGGVCSLTLDDRHHVVYRCLNVPLAREAAFVAQRLAGLDHILTPGHYNMVSCANSPFWSRNLGKRGHAFLQKLYDLVYSDQKGKGPDMFCSEFVTSCYEVAAMRLQTHALDVDPQGMTVRAMEEELNRHPRLFRMLGRYPK